MQNLSELSSRPRHQHKAKNVAFMDKFNMQLYYNISIFTDFQLWVIQLNEKDGTHLKTFKNIGDDSLVVI